MAFDGIFTSAVTRELARLLTGGKIEKIYQPESDEIIVHVRSQGGGFKLYASCSGSHARFHLIAESPQNPQAPPPFCMLLRKHLSGGRITGIAQVETERIVCIGVDTINEMGFSTSKKLMIEVMGKHSNIVLTDAASGKIIDSIKRVSIDESRVRQILPGKAYELPPSQGKAPFTEITPETVRPLLCCPPDLAGRALLEGIQGISPRIAERISSLAAAADPEALADGVYGEIVSMRGKLADGSYTPAVYFGQDGAPVDFHVFSLPSFEGLYEKRIFDTANECAEFYYIQKAGANSVKQKTADLRKAVKARLDKLYLKKQRLSEDLLKAQNSDTHRLYGELLTANLHMVKPGAKAVSLINYYDGSEISIPLDERLSPSKNAQGYFKKYGKAKTAIKEKAVQLSDTETDIAYLETIESFIERAASADDIEALRSELVEQGYLRRRKAQGKPAKTKLAPLQYKTCDGFRVSAGRNNQENDLLTFKSADRSDIWLHTKDIPGSHVILFTDGRQPGETAIFEAAAIAAYHSKGMSSENVPVDYTLVKHVKKPAGARPGMVIFTNNRTVYVNPKLP